MSGLRGWKTKLKPLTLKQRKKKEARNERRNRAEKIARRSRRAPGART